MPVPTHLTLHWPTEAACAASATRLAAALRAAAGLHDAFIELHGPLGAGKTTFVRHLLHALGVQGRVKSPTYAVVEEYEIDASIDASADASADASVHAPLHIWHFDFYRFDDPQEWEDAGFRDVFASPGLKLAEWPEKAEGLLPRADLRIDIDVEIDIVSVTDGELDGADSDADADADEAINKVARVARFTALSARGLELLK